MDTKEQEELKKQLNYRHAAWIGHRCGNCGAWTGESCQTTDGDDRFPTTEFMVCDEWEAD